MTTANDQIADVFSILHDGIISTKQIKQEQSKWKINCQYLAAIINPSFDHFFIEFKGLEEFSFTPWWNDETRESYNSIKDIECSLEILDAKVESGIIVITFNHSSTEPNFAGGLYNFKVDSIQIFDQENKTLEYEDLDNLAMKYWISN